MSEDVASLTDLLRSDSRPFWSSLRAALDARGVSVARAALAESTEQGDDSDFGVLVTGHGEVIEFGFAQSSGTFTEWQTITPWWTTTPYSASVEAAMRLLD